MVRLNGFERMSFWQVWKYFPDLRLYAYCKSLPAKADGVVAYFMPNNNLENIVGMNIYTGLYLFWIALWQPPDCWRSHELFGQTKNYQPRSTSNPLLPTPASISPNRLCLLYCLLSTISDFVLSKRRNSHINKIGLFFPAVLNCGMCRAKEMWCADYEWCVGHAVGSGTVLLAGRSRVRFPMASLLFFIYFRPHYSPGVDPTSNSSEYQVYILGWLSYHLHVPIVLKSGSPQPPGTLSAWNTPAQGLLYLFP
jgi:hypothetical protein